MEFKSLKYVNRSGQEKTGVLIGDRIIHRGRYRHDVVISSIEKEIKSVISKRDLEQTPELEQAGVDLESSLKMISECLLLNTRGWKNQKCFK